MIAWYTYEKTRSRQGRALLFLHAFNFSTENLLINLHDWCDEWWADHMTDNFAMTDNFDITANKRLKRVNSTSSSQQKNKIERLVISRWRHRSKDKHEALGPAAHVSANYQTLKLLINHILGHWHRRYRHCYWLQYIIATHSEHDAVVNRFHLCFRANKYDEDD